MSELKNELRKFITDSIMDRHNTDCLADDASFLENGVIDSTGVVELISYIETRFGITVQDQDLIPENLDSINGLVRFVEKKGGVLNHRFEGVLDTGEGLTTRPKG